MTQQLATPTGTPFIPPDADTYRYGFRDVAVRKADGTTDIERLPLSLEDLLHPHEGDFIVEKPIHILEREYIANVFRSRAGRVPGFFLLSDSLVNWGVPGIRNLAPDIIIFTELNQQPDLTLGVFPVVEMGAKALLALEIVSPSTRINDTEKKFVLYHRLGVPRYILVDQTRDDGPRTLIDYRHAPSRYEATPLDENGRIVVGELGISLGFIDDRVWCFDATTGEAIPDYQQLAANQDAAKNRIRELEAELRKMRSDASS